jgi:CRISPR-associated protein Csb1
VIGFRGGVAIKEARYLGFLDFAALRRLGFADYDATEVRVMLASLGLYALTLRAAAGWDLRARCSLVARGPLQFQLVGPTGEREPFDLGPDEARILFDEAVERAGVRDRSVDLKAGDLLNGLVDKAVAVAAADS